MAVITHTDNHDYVPDAFICPITQEVMVDPLMSKHGHNFERRAILHWLENDSCCPMTRKPLTPSMLFPNARLRAQMRSWQLKNKVEVTCKERSQRDLTILVTNKAPLPVVSTEQVEQLAQEAQQETDEEIDNSIRLSIENEEMVELIRRLTKQRTCSIGDYAHSRPSSSSSQRISRAAS